MILRAKLFYLVVFFLFACHSQKNSNNFQQEKIIFSEKDKAINLKVLYNSTEFSLVNIWELKLTFSYPTTYHFLNKYLSFLDYQPLALVTDPIEMKILNSKENTWEESFFYRIEAPSTGEFSLREKIFEFHNLETSEKAFLLFPSISIQVNINDDFKNQMQTINTPIEKKLNNKIIYTSILVILIILLASIYWWRKKQKVKEQEIIITEWALAELKKIKKDNLITTVEIKHYHLSLSKILREFFARQLSSKSLSQTKEEFLHEVLVQKDIQQKYKKLLQQYLDLSDMVKFAKYRTSENTNQEIFELVKDIITFYHNKQK